MKAPATTICLCVEPIDLVIKSMLELFMDILVRLQQINITVGVVLPTYMER